MMQGIDVDYGDQARWKKILVLPSQDSKKKRKKKEPSDGRYRILKSLKIRAPDTTIALLKKPKTKPTGPGRKPGGFNSDTHKKLTIRSYVHYEQTCYLTSLMQSYFAVYCFLGGFPNFDDKSALAKMVMHFKKRMEEPHEKPLLTKIRNQILDKEKIYSRMEWGSPLTIIGK